MKLLKIITAFLLFPVAAFAHPQLDHADPRVGSTVSASPTEVKIWFTEAFVPSGSSIQVFDSTGNEVDAKDSHPDHADDTLMIVSLGKLSSGKYKVHWHALCPCGQQTQGDFSFTVK